MVPMKSLYMLSIVEKLTPQKVDEICRKDYSYILVYRDHINNVVGVIKVKEFALKYLKSGNRPVIVKEICKEEENFLSVYADTNLLEMLMLFQTKSNRLALVSNKYKKIVPGVKSIEYSVIFFVKYFRKVRWCWGRRKQIFSGSVSYTHLTLPTKA